MIPIDRLLDRIRWDAEFGRASFNVGYWDRVQRRVVQVPLERAEREDGAFFAFRVRGDDGALHEVPLHRIREVRRDGALIWQRPEA
jgi:uncharacterized protein (UPF0248 family)